MTSGRDSFYDKAEVHRSYAAHRDGRPRHRSANHVMEEPAVLAELGDPAGLRILDLGCGDGRFGKWLLESGAQSYLGIDSSHRMVDTATRNLAGTGGQVRHLGIEDVRPTPDSMDLITARLSLHYVDDLDRVMTVLASGLAVGGRLIITVVHPVITSHDNPSDGPRTTWTVDDYFDDGPRQRQWMGSTVVWHHRTVGAYVSSVLRAGLTLTALDECAPDPARFDGDLDEYARRRRVPLFLLLGARRRTLWT